VAADQTFTFTLRAGTGAGTATINAQEVSGAALGSTTFTFTVPTVRRFDFNAPGSPTAAGYTGVLPTSLYFDARGFGWLTAARAFNRTDVSNPDPLLQDGAYGVDNTFKFQVTPGAIYQLTIYLGDYDFGHDQMQISVGGVIVGTYTTSAGKFLKVPYTTPAISPGATVFNLRIQDLGDAAGFAPYFAIDGVDIIQSSPQRADLRSVPAPGPIQPLTDLELTTVIQTALAIWGASGISTAQAAMLAAEPVDVATLGGTGFLGLENAAGIHIDATAAGYGWFVSANPDPAGVFNRQVAPGQLQAAAGSPSYGRMDLLTVVLHEFGHVLGMDDVPTALYPHDLMAQELATGTRRYPPGWQESTARLLPPQPARQIFPLAGSAGSVPAAGAPLPGDWIFVELAASRPGAGYTEAAPVLQPAKFPAAPTNFLRVPQTRFNLSGHLSSSGDLPATHFLANQKRLPPGGGGASWISLLDEVFSE